MSNQDLKPSQQHEGDGKTNSIQVTSIYDSPDLVFTQVGAHWHGRNSLRNLFVFGDSYSSKLSRLWTTDGEDPYDTDGDDATWINYFAASLSLHGSLPVSRDATVVKNFAFPGHTVKFDLNGQLAQFFEQFSENIEPENATYVFFLGINDCGVMTGQDSIPSLVQILFDAIQRLYTGATARNFILVDVPPTNRSPAGKCTARITTALAGRIEEWNGSLVKHASDFVSNRTQATMLVFSSHKVLSEILDDPGAHGFAENVAGRGIWLDGLHLTPESLSTQQLFEFLLVQFGIATLFVLRGARDERELSTTTMLLEIAPWPMDDRRPLPSCVPSLMPFHISYTGPAPVSRYFRPRPAPPSLAALSLRSSSTATLVASSSSTSALSETRAGLTMESSAPSTGSLAPESGEDGLASMTRTCVGAGGQGVQESAVGAAADVAIGTDSETQPVSDAVPSDDACRQAKRFVAAFRGRQMYGQAVDMPRGYGGLVLRVPSDSRSKGNEDANEARSRSKTRSATRRSKLATADDIADGEEARADEDDLLPPTKRLVPSSTFTSFTLWTPDRPLDEGSDEYVRALVEWTRLATEIHSYDEDDTSDSE